MKAKKKKVKYKKFVNFAYRNKAQGNKIPRRCGLPSFIKFAEDLMEELLQTKPSKLAEWANKKPQTKNDQMMMILIESKDKKPHRCEVFGFMVRVCRMQTCRCYQSCPARNQEAVTIPQTKPIAEA